MEDTKVSEEISTLGGSLPEDCVKCGKLIGPWTAHRDRENDVTMWTAKCLTCGCGYEVFND